MQVPLFFVDTTLDSCGLDMQWLGYNGSMSTAPGGCLDRDGDLATCTPHENTHLRDYDRMVREFLRASGKIGNGIVYPRGGVDGGFVHTCLGHADALRKNGPYTTMRSQAGVVLRDALKAWYDDDNGVGGSHWHLPCELNQGGGSVQCNPTCKAAWVGPPAVQVSRTPLHIVSEHPVGRGADGRMLGGAAIAAGWLLGWWALPHALSIVFRCFRNVAFPDPKQTLM